MSIGANPSLIIDTMVNTAMLGTGLRQAEAQVAQSTANMARNADAFSRKWGQGIESALFKFAGPMFALQVADQFARGFAESLQRNQTFIRTLEDVGYKVASGLPVIGPLYEARQRAAQIPGAGMSIEEAIFEFFTEGTIPFPAQLGGGRFRLGQNAGFVPSTGSRRASELEFQIERMQRQLELAQPVPTRAEMLSEQLSQQMGGAMGQAQTALGTFKFAQMGADAQADIVRNTAKQVDLMVQIRDATNELKKITASN